MIWTVYKLENKINGKCYIGITSQKPERRLKLHYHDVNSGYGKLLHKAMRKHGIDNFRFDVIGCAFSLENANQLEKLAIKIYKSKSPYGYNLTIGGDGTQDPSPETRAAMRAAQLGKKQSIETIEKRRIQQIGRKRNPDAVQKSADARRGVKRSEEFKQQCRERAAKQFADPEQKRLVSETMKAKWQNPEYRDMILQSRMKRA